MKVVYRSLPRNALAIHVTIGTNVSEVSAAHIIRNITVLDSSCGQLDPPQRWYLSSRLHGVICLNEE
jgi:hypothetical protein